MWFSEIPTLDYLSASFEVPHFSYGLPISPIFSKGCQYQLLIRFLLKINTAWKNCLDASVIIAPNQIFIDTFRRTYSRMTRKKHFDNLSRKNYGFPLLPYLIVVNDDSLSLRNWILQVFSDDGERWQRQRNEGSLNTWLVIVSHSPITPKSPVSLVKPIFFGWLTLLQTVVESLQSHKPETVQNFQREFDR